MDQLTPLLVAIISSALLQAAKKVQAIPLHEGQKARLRTALAVFVVAGGFVTAYLDGSLETYVASDYVQLGLVSAVTWVLGHGVYKISKGFTWFVGVIKGKE